MSFQITILEADLDAYKADPPTPSGLPRKFCACYDPFWQPERYGERANMLVAFGDSAEEAIASLKAEIRRIMKFERIRAINEVALDIL